MDKRIVAVIIAVVAVLGLVPILPKLMNKAPAGDPALDVSNQQRIEQAVAGYQQQTGYLPPSLDALVPNYLDAVPQPSLGGTFQYDAASGAVRNPNPATAAPVQAQGQRGGAPVSGGGPMGEVMTGIGIADELN